MSFAINIDRNHV